MTNPGLNFKSLSCACDTMTQSQLQQYVVTYGRDVLIKPAPESVPTTECYSVCVDNGDVFLQEEESVSSRHLFNCSHCSKCLKKKKKRGGGHMVGTWLLVQSDSRLPTTSLSLLESP